MVVTPETDPVLMPNEGLDHQQTQHAQPCAQINDIGFDLNQIQYSSIAASMNTNSSPPREPSIGFYLPSYNSRKRKNRSSIEGLTFFSQI